MSVSKIVPALIAAAWAAGATAAPTVEGYLPSHRGLDTALAAVDLHPYTDVALAFVNPDAAGDFTNGDAMACMTDRFLTPVPGQTLRNAVATIHAAHARAIGALAGAIKPACAGDWNALLTPSRRTATVAALVAFADAYGFDGLDVDIEAGALDEMVRSGAYTPFVTALGHALRADHKTLYGTTASYVGGMIPLAALPAFDRVEVMTYDDNVQGEEEASMSQFRSDLYLWLGRGVPKDRLLLGLPFYGRGYGSYQATYTYRDLAAQFGTPAGDVIGQMCATCSYITLNAPATITQKTALATAKAGGVMVWELSDDTPDATLVQAIEAGLGAPPPPPVAPVAAAPGTDSALARSDISGWTIFGPASYATIPAAGLQGGQALEVKVPKPTENSWDVGVTVPVTGAVKAGDRVTLAVRARLKAADPDTQLDLTATLEGVKSPYAEALNGTTVVTTQWQWLRVSGRVAADHAPGTLNAALQVGGAMKIIDLGPAVITDEGQP